MPPTLFLIAVTVVPALLLTARLTTWAILRRRNRRPGFIDLTPPTAPPRARKEPT